VTDPHGACDTGYVRALIQDTQPTAKFSVSLDQGPVPLTVTFTDASQSYDGVQAWHWDFGDNTTSHVSTPRHTYNASGMYPVTLTVVEADQDHHTTDPHWINVTSHSVPEPMRYPPTLTILDAASATAPGSNATYTFILVNNDPPTFNTSFVLETTVPANWSTILTPSDITLLSGSNQTGTLIVTPPFTTLPQRYNLTLTVWNTDAPDVSTTETLSLLVQDQQRSRVPPSLLLNLAVQSGAPGDAVTYLLTIQSNDPPLVNVSMFTLDAQVPSEWVGSFNVTSLTLASNTSATVAYTLTSPHNASSRDYHFTLRVTNTADAESTSHVTGIYRIPADTTPSDNGNGDNATTPVTVQITPEMPTTEDLLNFTITGPSENDTVIRVYVDDTLVHQNVSTGNYTYQAGPFSEGNHTYYLEIEEDDGTVIRDPPNGTKLFSIDPPSIGLPTIPWYLFLLPIIALILVNSASQYFNSKNARNNPTQPPPPSASSTTTTVPDTVSAEDEPLSAPS
jgi:PKD repeat protein